jgi:hypothetical protein
MSWREPDVHPYSFSHSGTNFFCEWIRSRVQIGKRQDISCPITGVECAEPGAWLTVSKGVAVPARKCYIRFARSEKKPVATGYFLTRNMLKESI